MQAEKYSRTAEQKVEIHYAHIGAMETADNPVKTEMEADGLTPSASISTRIISFI